MRRPALLLTLLIVAAWAFPLEQTDAVRLTSGDRQVTLLELYTSEGCSSCPPADRWFTALADDPRLFRTFVPIAFHVDYWDYIGWKDRFAQAEFSDRQRRYAHEGGTRTVYTPGMFRNGADWRGWRIGRAPWTESGRSGNLTLTVQEGRIEVAFNEASRSGDDLRVHVALLGMGLESTVRAGENRGRTLRHDFVALDVRSVALDRTASGYSATLALPRSDVEAGRHALVAWVSSKDSQTPLQAAGGFL